MRVPLTFAATVALAALLAPVSSGQAADTPDASQIIKSLTPDAGGTMVTRGIRMGGQPPGATTPGAPAGAAGMARPAEANLNVPFVSGSAAISPAAGRVLDQLGEALSSPKLADYKFRVEGHTDTVGAPEMNKALSEQRAASVADYLVTKFNIVAARA